MSTSSIAGIVLVAVGVVDALVGVFLLAPRIRDERQRKVVTMALALSGGVLAVGGVLLLAGVISLG